MNLIRKDNTENQLLPVMPIVRYAPLGELKIYAISEDELDRLAKDGDESIYLNFALALLPTSLSLFVTLLSTTINSNRVFVAFLVTAIMTLIAGLILFALWWRNRGSNQALAQKIKDRMPPPGAPIVESEPQQL
jgi:hypothetical protein